MSKPKSEEKTGFKNQESFTIDKKIDKANKRFIELEKDALGEAFHHLTPTELVLYLYIMSNCDGVEWAFSMADAVNKTGYTDRALRNAKHGLKEKGYGDKNGKIFHQYKDSGIIFHEEAEKDSSDSGKKCRTNINECSEKINDNRDKEDTSTASDGSILCRPKEEEFYF